MQNKGEKMKLAAIVLTYNPEEIGVDVVAKNITTYAGACERVYIVDNSLKPSRIPFEGCTFIHNKNVGGIGGGTT